MPEYIPPPKKSTVGAVPESLEKKRRKTNGGEKRRKTYQFQSHFPKFFGCTFRICWPHRQIHHFLFIGSIKSSRNFQSIGTSSSPNSAYSLILDHFEVLTPSTVLNSAKSQKNKANHPKGTPESNSSRNFAVERPIQMKNNNIFVKKTNK